jgi:hypothetical protein
MPGRIRLLVKDGRQMLPGRLHEGVASRACQGRYSRISDVVVCGWDERTLKNLLGRTTLWGILISSCAMGADTCLKGKAAAQAKWCWSVQLRLLGDGLLPPVAYSHESEMLVYESGICRGITATSRPSNETDGGPRRFGQRRVRGNKQAGRQLLQKGEISSQALATVSRPLMLLRLTRRP